MPSTHLKAEYEKLLAESGLALPTDPPNESIVEEFRAAHRDTKSDSEIETLLTQVSRGGFQPMLEQLSGEVERDIKTVGGTLSRGVFVGEFPTGDLNARVLGRDRGYIVLLNNGLLMTTFLILKAMASAFAFGRIGPDGTLCQTSADARPTNDTVNELSDILQAYHRGGDSRLARRQPVLTGEQEAQLSRTLWAAEKFVVAHEYAHVLSGHVNRAVVTSAKQGEPHEYVTPSQQEEFDADLRAMTILMASADWSKASTDARFRIAGPFVFLGIHGMLTRVGDVLYGRTVGYSPSHPRTEKRIERLRSHVFQKYGSKLYGYADVFLTWLCSYTDFIVDASQRGRVFDPEECMDLYLRVISTRRAAITVDEKARSDEDAERLRRYWEAHMGEDSLNRHAREKRSV